jgi:hypothetical protein
MTTVPPPDVPAGVDPKLADFLRRFSLWAYREFDKKASTTEAVPQLLFSASDEKPPRHVFEVTVNSAGALAVTAVPLGGGKP